MISLRSIAARLSILPVIALASCSGSDRVRGDGVLASTCALRGPDSLVSSWVTVRDSVALDVPDSVLLASPSSAIRSPGGLVGLLDGMEYNIKLFGRDGSYLRTVGHRGMGPGEIGRLHSAMFVNDSTLLVVDGQRGRTMLFSIAGKLLSDQPGPVGAVGGAGLMGDRVLVGVYEDDTVASANAPRTVKSARWISVGGTIGRPAFALPASHVANARFLSRPPIVGRMTGRTSPIGILTWGWADSIYLVNPAGDIVVGAALEPSDFFRPATAVSSAVSNATLETVLQVTTPIVDVSGFEDRIYLSSVFFSGSEGRLRYRILDADLRTIAVDLTADMRIFAGTDSGMIGLRGRIDSVTNTPTYSVLSLNPCVAR